MKIYIGEQEDPKAWCPRCNSPLTALYIVSSGVAKGDGLWNSEICSCGISACYINYATSIHPGFKMERKKFIEGGWERYRGEKEHREMLKTVERLMDV